MSGFNGSGTFNISGIGLPYTSNTTISSSVANTLNTQIATGLSTCILKDGTQTITANIPFSNYKITGLGTGTLSADAASVYNLQCSTGILLTVTGADTIVGSATPSLPISSSYVTGMTFRFFAAGTNTGAVTINIDSLGAKAITKNGTTALVAGDIPSGVLVSVTYDGTRFVLQNQSTFAVVTTATLTVTGNASIGGNATVTNTLNVANLNVTQSTSLSCQIGMHNRIINGNMVIDQRNAGAAVTPAAGISNYTLDRWNLVISQSSKLTVQQVSDAPTGFINSLKVTVASQYAPNSTDYFGMSQVVEGYNIADLSFGASGAATITLSAQVKSSITGTFTCKIGNSAATRSYVGTYTISAANTWIPLVITIAGDTTGTWLTTTGIGVQVYFDLGSGSNFNGTASAWTAGNYTRTSGSVSFVNQTAGATWQITGVQLEKGPSATPFEYRPIGIESTLCQRYWQYATYLWSGNCTNASNYYSNIDFPVIMRASPTITFSSVHALLGFASGGTTYSALGNNWGFAYKQANSTQTAGYFIEACILNAEL